MLFLQSFSSILTQLYCNSICPVFLDMFLEGVEIFVHILCARDYGKMPFIHVIFVCLFQT